MGQLDNKIAIVTGAGQGIGRATAEMFRDAGATVQAIDINPDTIAALDGVRSAALDVTDSGAIAEFAAALPRVDVLANCAGYVHNGTILECDEAAWDFSFNLNVKSMYSLTRVVLPMMLAVGGGSIVNMSSVASSIKGVPNRFVYGASKAAMIGLTKFVARQPMGRIGEPQEIARLALDLATTDSAFTTAQCHVVDGGWSM